MKIRTALPEAILSQHIAVLGKTGSGKTSTAKLAIEQVVAQGARVCILDPIKSDWWGLTSTADGRRAGLPFHILGGPRGHVPLHASAGKAVAEIVASGALPLSIIDMADFSPGGQAQFFVDFAPALLKRMRGVIYLVLEEAHLFAPKERSGVGQENMAIHWAKMLATAGRSKGIRLILVTQRTQALHNALLGSCDTLIAHRLTAPADQTPVIQWLRANVEKSVADTVASSLSQLSTGSAWVCSGEAKIFERREFPRISTYDNSATPDGSLDEQKVKTAPVDQDKLRAIIGAAVEEAKANDPVELKRQIAELRKAATAPREFAVDEALLERTELQGYQRGRRELESAIKEAREYVSQILGHAGNAAKVLDGRFDAPTPIQRHVSPAPAVAKAALVRQQSPSVAVDLTGPQRQLLQALAWWKAMGNEVPSRVQAATLCGWRITSGHIKNVAGSLSSRGLITYPQSGSLALTPEGVAAAPQPDVSTTLIDSLRAILTGPQLQVFDFMHNSNKTVFTREELCEGLGWNASSGHIKNVIGSMSSLEIVYYPQPGSVQFSDWVR